jgi:hypothetical protein
MADCSKIEKPVEWEVLFQNATKLALEVGDTSINLKQLEGKFILCFSSNLFIFLDIHVKELGGHLPYEKND